MVTNGARRTVVGSFDEQTDAKEARHALESAGFVAESIALDSVGLSTLALLTGIAEHEWQEQFAEMGKYVVLVANAASDEQAQRLLQAHGARHVFASDASASKAPAPENRPSARTDVHLGMTVMSADQREVGRVKDVREGAMLVNRPMRPDVWVPLSSVDRTIEHWVVLTVSFEQVDLAASFLLDR